MWCLVVVLAATAACTNPFAPSKEDSAPGSELLGDQRTIDGVFKNFRYSYIFKDTLIYGRLLADDFKFIFHNFDRGVDITWGRDEDMLSTAGLFQSTDNLDLVWNEIFNSPDPSSLIQDVSRGFRLTVTYNPANVETVDGTVDLRLRRDHAEAPWKIIQWHDRSNL